MTGKNRLRLGLALAAGLTIAGPSWAQVRLTNDGRLNEANNRIGSNGYNDSVRPIQAATGNQIITGDVTGGRQFQGVVPYTNPTSFRGPTASDISNNFIRSSAAPSFGGINQNNAQNVQPYYGPGNFTAPPQGFTQQSAASGAYVPGAPQTVRAPGDLRLGQVLNTPSLSGALPQPGAVMMPGAVDPNTQSSNMLGASPLYGVRQLNQKNPTFDQAMTNSAFNNSATKYPSTPMDPMKLQQMRQQLLDSQAKPLGQNSLDQNSDQNSDQDSTTPGNAAKMGLQSLGSPMQAPFESPENGAVRNSTSIVQPTQGGTTVGLSANLATGQSVKQRLVNQPVRIQSAQYSELQKRLAQYKSIQDQTTAQAAVQYNNDQVRAKNTPAAQGGGKPGDRPVLGGLPQPAMPGPGAGQREVSPIPAGPAMPSSATDLNPTPNVTPAMPGVKPGETAVTGNKIETMPMPVRPAPLKIKSLADGVQAKGIADMLKDAEELTRNGKYNSALEQYDMADQVAPNNALVQLGRANVELGRTYYARAEANLRQAFTQDQALLMGQYDLTSLLGQERLETIVRDLRAIAEREQKEPRPMFLLAYIAYNTGNEPRAAAYLDLAEKRAGGHDPLYPLIRKHWALPSDAAPVNATK